MHGIERITADTIADVSKSILTGTADGSLRKGLSIAGDPNLTGVSLEAPAKQLVPLLSPFRQTIGRATRSGAVASQWRAITGLSNPKVSVAETNPGPTFTTTSVAKTATYKITALRGQVTREMVAASEGFDPALAKETANTLLLAMKLEEIQMLGGNTTAALATPTGGTATSVAVAGGAFPASAHFFRVAALTLAAANRIQIDKPADLSAGDALLAPRAVTGVDPAADGVTVTSASFTVTPTLNHGVRLSWTPVPGAAAYAVYCGLVNDATVKCQCVVTQAFVTLLSGAAAGDAASVLTGTSQDLLAYDGIIPQLWAAGSGAYQKNLAGVLTQANGELTQLQDAFQNIWDTAKIGSFRILVSGQEARKLTSLGVVSGGGPTLQYGPEGARGRLTQGYAIGAILNSVTGDVCPIETLPWMTPGQIVLLPTSIPYPDSNASAPFDMAMGYDWERWDYSSTAANGNARVYPFEVVCYGAMRAIFTGGCGVIHNIYKG